MAHAHQSTSRAHASRRGRTLMETGPRGRGAAVRRRWLGSGRASAALIGLLLALLLPPATHAAVGGPIWLPTQQVTSTMTNKLATSMATYRNHAYILWLGDAPPGQVNAPVYFSTNASGAWKTRLLSSTGPGAGGEEGNSPDPLIA